ncbi:MAG: hypothetical protein M0D54_16845 [Hyphomonadaceae bacterium JAD_PAG50586_4]|nr:MAG: hypothetical protein M0D54_16845 [Hyphomonadaceae bacterium JAD_PAG50586_4]
MVQTVRISLDRDNLDEEGRRFAKPPIAKPTFLNSVPKCGTHLIRNIVRMFVQPEQQYDQQFLQHAILLSHRAAFDPKQPKLSWGHLFFSDIAAVLLRDVNHIVLVRDPYDWVLARTRFFLSEQFNGNLNHIKNGAAGVNEVMNLMIFGALDKAPSLADIFNFNGVAWMGTGAHVMRYEEIIKNLKAIDTPAAEVFFRDLICTKAGVTEWPQDWKERVLIGSDRKHSGTAREHLRHDIEVPEVLPEVQKRLVDYHAPGLRQILGYF